MARPGLEPGHHDFQTSPIGGGRKESPAKAQGWTKTPRSTNLANSVDRPSVSATRAAPWPELRLAPEWAATSSFASAITSSSSAVGAESRRQSDGDPCGRAMTAHRATVAALAERDLQLPQWWSGNGVSELLTPAGTVVPVLGAGVSQAQDFPTPSSSPRGCWTTRR